MASSDKHPMPALDFETFVRKHRPIIAKVCWLYACSSDDFDDLYQEILLNLWRGSRISRDAAKRPRGSIGSV